MSDKLDLIIDFFEKHNVVIENFACWGGGIETYVNIDGEQVCFLDEVGGEINIDLLKKAKRNGRKYSLKEEIREGKQRL